MVSFFCEEKDFQKRVQLLNSQLQGQEFYTNMLADLQVAHNLLNIFFDKKTHFSAILAHVQENTEGGNLEKLKVIETSMSNLNEITGKFMQINEGIRGVIPRILHFMEHGW